MIGEFAYHKYLSGKLDMPVFDCYEFAIDDDEAFESGQDRSTFTVSKKIPSNYCTIITKVAFIDNLTENLKYIIPRNIRKTKIYIKIRQSLSFTIDSIAGFANFQLKKNDILDIYEIDVETSAFPNQGFIIRWSPSTAK